jgi:hypothetical protein
MPVSLITLVDVDRVWIKSRIGVDWTDVGRNDSFDAYTVLTESSEVYVVPDVANDKRFQECDLQFRGSPIRFYAGAAIIVDDVKIGALCVLDTEPHLDFSLEDKENLLDMCVGVSQLAQERRQRSLDLDVERANIVVSMMHNLRTPMTTLNFATSLLTAEALKLRPTASEDTADDDDGSDDGNTMAPAPSAINKSAYLNTPAAFHVARSTDPSPTTALDHVGSGDSDPDMNANQPGSILQTPPPTKNHDTANGVPDVDAMVSMFSTFDVCYREINVALKQLNLIVDSTLTLGQAVVKANEQPIYQGSHKSANSMELLSSVSVGSEKSSVANGSAVRNLGALTVSAPLSANASANVSACPTPKFSVGGSKPLFGARSATNLEASPFYPEMDGCRYVSCDLLEHVNTICPQLVSQTTGSQVTCEVTAALLQLGRHASYPEAVTLVLMSALGQQHGQHKNVRLRFHFERCVHEEDLEFPAIAHKLIEGTFVIRVQAFTHVDRNTTATAASGKELSGSSGRNGTTSKHISFSAAVDAGNVFTADPSATPAEVTLSALQHQGSELGGASTASNKTTFTTGTSVTNAPLVLPHVSMDTSADQTDQYIAQYNLMSVNKVLRTVNGGCHEYMEPIPLKEGHVLDPEDGFSEPPVLMPTQEYWIPCKILPSTEALQRMSLEAYLEKDAEQAREAGRDATVKQFYNRAGSQKHSMSLGTSTDNEGSRQRLLSDTFSSSAPTSVKIRPALTNSGSLRMGLNASNSSDKRAAATGTPTGSGGAVQGSDAATAGSASPDAEPKTLRVLIIEDTIPVQKLLSRWMQKAKCKVSCAGNGSIGLSMLMSSCFDIAFVDFLMVRKALLWSCWLTVMPCS